MPRPTGLLPLPLLALLTVFALSSPARSAFHDGSEASCVGCHQDRINYPLKGTDASSTCLGCHADTYRVLSEDGSAYTPAGDFFWLTQAYDGSGFPGGGERHGHNVVAAGFGLVADATLWSGPSNGSVTYRSAWLQCTSCHDPHGTAQTGYRLLGGTGYEGGALAIGISFTNPAPQALACLDRDGELLAETDRDHPDYGAGMSEWCTNCHSGFDGAHAHPAGNKSRMGKLAASYNAYLATGNLSGSQGTSFDFLVPFERGTGELRCDRTDGPSADSAVMCLSCHRVHASAFDGIGRWDFGAPFLAYSPVLSSPEAQHAYYGEVISSRYGLNQQTLCNKCHVKD